MRRYGWPAAWRTAGSTHRKLWTRVVILLVLAHGFYPISGMANVSPHEIPRAPIAPVDTAQCQEYHRRMTELIRRQSDSAFQCISRGPSLPQGEPGPCCREYAGQASGVCRVPAHCAGVSEQRYCLINETQANFDACIQQVARRNRSGGGGGPGLGGTTGGPSRPGAPQVFSVSREIDVLRSKVDGLRQLASPGLRHALARRVVEEALHHTLALTGDALRQFDMVMLSFDKGVQLPAPGTPEAQAAWLRHQIATTCGWQESSGALVRCVNEQLLLNRIAVVRQY
jgi:hypothetical protein